MSPKLEHLSLGARLDGGGDLFENRRGRNKKMEQGGL